MTAQAMIDTLGLKPHPEGGHYRETFRSGLRVELPGGTRGPGARETIGTARRDACTSVLFLLQQGERSAWHAVDADELWCWHGGAPLELCIAHGSRGEGTEERHTLGLDVAAGQTPQATVPAHAWQAARSLGAWSLVGCVVAPGFEFSGFRLAPPGWHPGDAVD
ncbi:MAG: cupin domain-containing protein [Planctomycetota bacterium]